jgi:hypothetical protein
LRGEGLPDGVSGTIGFSYSNVTPPVPITQTGRDLLDMLAMSNSKPFGDNHWSARLQWTPNEFSTFAFDFIAMLKGTYVPSRSSSQYGQSWVDFSKGSSATKKGL